MLDFKEEENKITLTETNVLEVGQLLDDYHSSLLAKKVFEKRVEMAPTMISNIKAQIDWTDALIQANEDKVLRLDEILKGVEANIPKRCEEVRAKYTDDEIIKKTRILVNNSKLEVRKVGDKFEMITTSTNDVEDLLMEFMFLQTQKPELLEEKIKLTKQLESTQETINKASLELEKTDSKLSQIEKFFMNKKDRNNQNIPAKIKLKGTNGLQEIEYQNINELLDKWAQIRPRTAGTLKLPA